MHVKGNHVCTFTWRPLNKMLHHGCYFRQNKIIMLSKNVLARSRPVLDVVRLHAVPLNVAKQVAMVEARRYVADPDAKGIVHVSHDDGRLWAQIAADDKNQPLSLHEVLRCCWCQLLRWVADRHVYIATINFASTQIKTVESHNSIHGID